MSVNLLVWKRSEDLDTPSKRRKNKMSDVASSFAESGEHPAIGEADFSVYLEKVTEQFGSEELHRPFVIENYNKAVVFNYGSESRFEIVPILGQLASSCGFNATEF